MTPRAEIPRSSFNMQRTLKTTFNASYLVPMFCEEVLPGDSWRVHLTAFGRLATPLFPVMDNLHLDTFFFFVPNRLTWSHWVNFMGEQPSSPSDSISYVIPQLVSPVGGFVVGSIYDYYGLPTVGQVLGANTVSVNALPLRAYALIYNQWFRDENLQLAYGTGATNAVGDIGDGPDPNTNYALAFRGKRVDYFTGCLPWPQKGGTAVSIPLGTSAPVRTNLSSVVSGAAPAMLLNITTGALGVTSNLLQTNAGGSLTGSGTAGTPGAVSYYPNNLYADLSTATAATINQLRQSFQIQKLLERDARGGTRYTEIIRSHFGVVSPDARLQRPEYLGGGSTMISINPVAQTSGTSATGTTTPLATLAGMGTYLTRGHGFSQSFTEHGYIIGLMMVRADLTYQQGYRRMWRRSTRYDFYFPAFAMLGEQPVYNEEIYADGSANDDAVFGYQERWAEYRYLPSQITGLFRSTAAGTIDPWHYSTKFTALPVLNGPFIQDSTFTTLQRNIAVGAAANGQQLLFDGFFDCKVVRPLPLYSVPGLIDHF
jgi:hypothetical protein